MDLIPADGEGPDRDGTADGERETDGKPGPRGSDAMWDLDLSDVCDAALRGAASARGRKDPEDAAQDAVEGMLRSGRTYDRPTAVARVAGRRRGIDQGRRVSRRRAIEGVSWADRPAVVPSAEDEAIPRLMALSLLEIAKEELTPAQFHGLRIVFEVGCSVNEAAQMLAQATGESPETIRTKIRRGALKLRSQNEDRCD
jgi:DNA-directed RNA polymerase specialized sigma24 family protein